MSGFIRFQPSPPTKVTKPTKVTPEPEIITPDLSHFSHFSRGVTSKYESVTTCQITGDTCLIRYTPDRFKLHGHRNGEQITIDGTLVTLRIEEVTPCRS